MRKSVRKAICLILSLLMVACLALTTVAETPKPQFTVASVSGSAGYEVTVGISLDTNPNIGAIKFEINYDSSKLEFSGYADGALTGWTVSGYTGCEEELAEGKKPAAVWYSKDGSTATGTILKLKFLVDDELAVGTETAISLSAFDVADGDETEIAVETVSGKVTVVDGVTISGTVVSWNNTDNAIYLLYPSTTTDVAIRKEWQGSDPYTGTAYDAGGDIGSVTVESKSMYSQAFEFTGIAPGNYKLAIFKPGKYVPKVVSIELTGNTDLGQLKMWLYGDVNYDGSVTSADVLQCKRKLATGLTSVFTKGDAQEIADRIVAADVTAIIENSPTGEITSGDVLQIQRKLATGLTSVFDKMK